MDEDMGKLLPFTPVDEVKWELGAFFMQAFHHPACMIRHLGANNVRVIQDCCYEVQHE